MGPLGLQLCAPSELTPDTGSLMHRITSLDAPLMLLLALACVMAACAPPVTESSRPADTEPLDPIMATTSDEAAMAYILAGIVAKRGEYEEAVEHFDEALRRDPNFLDAHLDLGLLLLRHGEAEPASTHLAEVVRLAPDNADYRVYLGAALGEQGELDAAAEQFTKALQIDPEHADAQEALEVVKEARAEEE